MENQFDKDLKQRLDNASLQEAGVRFDKDKLWGKIENKRNKKRVPFLPWVSHAAAVAAGLAIGILFFVRKDQAVNEYQVMVQQKNTPVLQTIIDTVYIVKNEKGQTQQPSVLRKTTKAQLPASVTTVQEPMHIATETKLPEKEVQPVVALNSHVPLKVLHLSDMDNENSKPRPALKSNFAFLKKYTKQNNQETNMETFSMIIGKTLFNSKN